MYFWCNSEVKEQSKNVTNQLSCQPLTNDSSKGPFSKGRKVQLFEGHLLQERMPRVLHWIWTGPDSARFRLMYLHILRSISRPGNPISAGAGRRNSQLACTYHLCFLASRNLTTRKPCGHDKLSDARAHDEAFRIGDQHRHPCCLVHRQHHDTHWGRAEAVPRPQPPRGSRAILPLRRRQ